MATKDPEAACLEVGPDAREGARTSPAELSVGWEYMGDGAGEGARGAGEGAGGAGQYISFTNNYSLESDNTPSHIINAPPAGDGWPGRRSRAQKTDLCFFHCRENEATI